MPPQGAVIGWSARDLKCALLRRAGFPRAGRRRRRSGPGIRHAGVSRRAIHRLGQRAAAALIRQGRPDQAVEVIDALLAGGYHDERMLALEILDRLVDVWRDWAVEMVIRAAGTLDHPWVADRLAKIQGKIIARNPGMLRRHTRWAVHRNPLVRRAAALALLPGRRRGTSRGVHASRALPVLRLLLADPEPHPWVQQAVGRVLVHYAERAPRTIHRLLADPGGALHPRHLDRARRLVDEARTAG